MPIRVTLDLLPEEAEALKDFAEEHAAALARSRALAGQTVSSYLERALRYLHGAAVHQLARYVPYVRPIKPAPVSDPRD